MRKLGSAWTLIIAGAALALGAALPVGADEQTPYRVRGTLEAVEGDKLTVNTREGEHLDLALQDDTRVLVVRPASLDDVKQGDYVGLTSVDAAGKRVAISMHIFADDLRGTAEGHVPWDLVKEPNTMTNATVAEAVVARVAESTPPVSAVARRAASGPAHAPTSQTATTDSVPIRVM